MSQESEVQGNKLNLLYRLAVLIMSTISAVTTALGAKDLFGLWMAVALAIGISVLLIAVAFNLPKAFQEGRQTPLLLGYTFIALISVLFNFNYIYGKFAAEDLLYTELINKREQIDALEIKAVNFMDQSLNVSDLRATINELELVMEREKNHPLPGQSGEGPRYKKAAFDRRIAEEQLNANLKTKKYYYDRIQADANALKTNIDNAVNSERDLEVYRKGIEESVKGFNELRNFVLKETSGLEVISMKFVNKDIGKLNHTIWTFTQFGNLTGKQRSSLLVALIISLAIDFVILFVLAVVSNSSGQPVADSNYEKMDPRQVQTGDRRRRKSDKDLFYRQK